MANYATTDMTGGKGTSGESLVTNTVDPWRDLILNAIMQSRSTTGEIPDYTLAQLENFTRNPGMAGDIAGPQFQQIAGPLADTLKPMERRETQAQADAFRKAGVGSFQSGAFANATRGLIGDQAARRNQLLASNYVPLTGQVSENINNAIRSGLMVPQATAEANKPLASSLSSLLPLQTRTQQRGVTQDLTAAGGQDKAAQANQIAQLVGSYSQLSQPARNYWS